MTSVCSSPGAIRALVVTTLCASWLVVFPAAGMASDPVGLRNGVFAATCQASCLQGHWPLQADLMT